MTDGGLTLSESLALARRAFVHPFLSSAQREAVIKQAVQRIYALLTTLDDGRLLPSLEDIPQ